MVLKPSLRWVLHQQVVACFMVGLLLESGLTLAAIDNSDTWYQIEVIVAKRIDHSNSSEAFPSAPALLSFQGARTLTEFDPATSDSFALDSEEFINLPLDQRLLNNEAQTLTNNDAYSVLLHQSWRQILAGNKVINWIDIKAGFTWGGLQQLEGRLGFSKGRYLHLHSDLHLNQFPTIQSANSQRATRHLFSLESPLVPAIETRYSLVQRRKMRSNELHYLDHPKLVLLVKVIPYTPSEPILEAQPLLAAQPILEVETPLETDPSSKQTSTNEPKLVDLTVPNIVD